MRKLLCLVSSLAAAASFGAYQYIISSDPELAVNPSNSTCSAAVSIAANTSGEKAIETSLETRYRTFAESNVSDLDRRWPGAVMIIF